LFDDLPMAGAVYLLWALAQRHGPARLGGGRSTLLPRRASLLALISVNRAPERERRNLVPLRLGLKAICDLSQNLRALSTEIGFDC